MQFRGPLMVEHRLIEGMMAVITRRVGRSAPAGPLDPGFVDAAVDFIRVYADRTHHGKEEGILFASLKQKALTTEHRQMMEGLVADHAFSRETTRIIAQANTRYREGDASALGDINAGFRALLSLYPTHIKKEDEVFFPAALGYLTEAEGQAMLRQFEDFDRSIIHEKYRGVVKSLTKG